MTPCWKEWQCHRCYNVRVLARSGAGKPFCDICKKRMNVSRWYV